MPGGDRGGRIAALGAVLTIAVLVAIATAFAIGIDLSQQPEAYPRYKNTQPDQAGPHPALGLHVEAPEYKQPCRNPEGHDESDLCAQWRAANNAGQAADWAFWQFALSIFGVVGLIGTILLTIRATNAAVEANELSRENSRLELRAYLDVEAISFFNLAENAGNEVPDGIKITIRNYGATPAIRLVITADLRMSGLHIPGQVRLVKEDIEPKRFGLVAPHDTAVWNMVFQIPDYVWLGIKGRLATLQMDVRFEYHDMFKAKHFLEAIFESSGADPFIFVPDTRRGDDDEEPKHIPSAS